MIYIKIQCANFSDRAGYLGNGLLRTGEQKH